MAVADVLVVSVDSTGGWTASAAELAAALERCGASVAVASTGPVRLGAWASAGTPSPRALARKAASVALRKPAWW